MKLIIAVALFTSLASASAESWTYQEDVDKMTSKVTTYASLDSSNSLRLSAPYSGENTGWVTVRKHASMGLDVMVVIRKGQILCPSYSGCNVKVRFGEGQPVTFSALPPSDHSSTSVFIRNAQSFIDKAKIAKTIKVQLEIYQNGPQILEFEASEPLSWGPKVVPVGNSRKPVKAPEADLAIPKLSPEGAISR